MTKAKPITQKRKFKALVHYVCDQCADPTMLGATKLNKVLWYSDTLAYRLRGKSISGETVYIKRQYGPVPKQILQTLEELERGGALKIRETPYFNKKKREFIALESSDPSVFTDEERDIIDIVISAICKDHTASSISEMSHDAIWEAAQLGEEIPIYAVLAANAAPITKQHEAWANKIIAARGRGGKVATR